MPRRATPGSTSYDEAAHDPFEPDWSGGSWYGESSGTYWTINPREYADPRKHGPEYLARARKAAQSGDGGDDGDAAGWTDQADPTEPRVGQEADATGGEDEPSWTTSRARDWTWSERSGDRRSRARTATSTAGAAPGASGAAPGASGATAGGSGKRQGDSRPGAPGDAGPAPGGASSRRGRWAAGSEGAAGFAPGEVRWGGAPAGFGRPSEVGGAAREPSPSGGGSFEFIGLGVIAERIRHEPARPRVRLALALAGWPPIGLAIALAFGELTGCARFAATCANTSSFSGSVIAAQVVVLAMLLLIPPIARIAAFGSLAILLAALPVVAFLTAAGASYDPEPGSAALLTLLTVAWGIGVAVGLPFRSRTMPP